jgi:hypothetical protein
VSRPADRERIEAQKREDAINGIRQAFEGGAYGGDLAAEIAIDDLLAEVDRLLDLLASQGATLEELDGWKADALQSLAGWHHLGDVLLALAPGRLGCVIPEHLAAAVPELIVTLRATLEERTRERDLAIAHDRQPYPTAHAYETVCAALQTHKARAEAAEATLTAAQEAMTGALELFQVQARVGGQGGHMHARIDGQIKALEAALTASPAAKEPK